MYSIRSVFSLFATLSLAHVGSKFLYGVCLQGMEALQYSEYALRGADAKHLSEYFRPHTISFTLQKQQTFREKVYDVSKKYVGNCSSMQCLRNFDEIDGFLYTWEVVDNVPMACTHDGCNKFEDRKKLRHCNGSLNYLRHLRSFAVTGRMG